MTRIGVARGRGKVVLVQAGNRLCRSLANRIFNVSVGKEPYRQTSLDVALIARMWCHRTSVLAGYRAGFGIA